MIDSLQRYYFFYIYVVLGNDFWKNSVIFASKFYENETFYSFFLCHGGTDGARDNELQLVAPQCG